MITVKINEIECQWGDVGPEWINQQITGRRKENIPICVIVTITERGANISLAAGNCPTFTSGNWTPPPTDQKVSDLWEECGLRKHGFTGGNLISFLQRVDRLLGR